MGHCNLKTNHNWDGMRGDLENSDNWFIDFQYWSLNIQGHEWNYQFDAGEL